MGEVYRARDTKLRREVAIKILPPSFAHDVERVQRFEREAHLLASLNHPHIGAIYGFEERDDIYGLVLELVEGETLAEKLARVPAGLPVAEALTIARQVADALDTAHEKGIVHRDLKPANIKITPEGTVKVLDFGLAKATASEASSAGLSHSPTLTMEHTQDGTILGTAPYMSPEQVRGKLVDKRADIWAFGCVLYELLTGQRAFGGDTVSDTIARILEREPDWTPLPATTPINVRRLLQRCLEKDARQRLRDIGDARMELHETLIPASIVPKGAPTRVWRRGRLWAWAAGASVLLAVVTALALWKRQAPETSWQNPFANARFDRLTDFEGSELDAAISADGKFVVFIADRDGTFDAFVTQVGSGEFHNLTSGRTPELLNEDVPNVGFSPDGANVWLRAGGLASPVQIRIVPTMGGTVRPFLDTAAGVAWSPDGSVVAYHEGGPGDPIYLADRNASNPRRIFVDQPGVHCHFLTWSPDGRFLYFVRGYPPNEMDIWRLHANGGEPERVTQHNSRVAYPTFLDDHTLIYTATADDGGGPWLYSIDVGQRVPHRVTTTVEHYISIAASVATPGKPRRLVATVSNPSVNLWTVPITDRLVDESAVTRFALPTARSAAPRFGPDYIVYLASRGGADGVWKFKDGSATELWRASDGPAAAAAGVSPDGRQVCFPVRARSRTALYCTTADGTNAHAVAESLDVRGAVSWSPDGQWIAVAGNQADGPGLFKVQVAGGPPIRLVDSVAANPVWSPDGTYILYSLYSGPRQGRNVQVKAVTPAGQPHTIPNFSVDRMGESYRFLAGGTQLVLKQGGLRRQNFWLFDLTTGRQQQITDLKPGSSLRSFDVSADGRSILFERVRENSDIVLIELAGR